MSANVVCKISLFTVLKITNLLCQVELSKFVADHDFCLEIMYEEQHQPHVIIEKADSLKGDSVYFSEYVETVLIQNCVL